jgi:hypothetical protein
VRLLLLSLVFLLSCTSETAWRRVDPATLYERDQTMALEPRCNEAAGRIVELVDQSIPEIRTHAYLLIEKQTRGQGRLEFPGLRCPDETSADTLRRNYYKISMGWSEWNTYNLLDEYLISKDFTTVLVYDRDTHTAKSVAEVRASGRWEREWR